MSLLFKSHLFSLFLFVCGCSCHNPLLFKSCLVSLFVLLVCGCSCHIPLLFRSYLFCWFVAVAVMYRYCLDRIVFLVWFGWIVRCIDVPRPLIIDVLVFLFQKIGDQSSWKICVCQSFFLKVNVNKCLKPFFLEQHINSVNTVRLQRFWFICSCHVS